MDQALKETAVLHVKDILDQCMRYTRDATAVIVADERSELSKILTHAYRVNLPDALCIQFDSTPPEEILKIFEPLKADDFVVLIQSTSFRLNEFRIRVELFKKGLKVIEHPHLARMTGQQAAYYIDSLAYDSNYYRVAGPKLKMQIDQAESCVVDSGGEKLVYEGGFESAKLNIGDYTGMNNIGGQFPIGEVFTEAKELEKVNGKVRIFAFGDGDFNVNVPAKPITLVIAKGQIESVEDSTKEFDRIVRQIKDSDGALWVRELGFGMNRSLTSERIVADIGTFERMCGIHLSLGNKHAIYKKPNFKQRAPGFHLDIFAVTNSVMLDGETIYQNGQWIV